MKKYLSLCMLAAFLIVEYSNAQVIELPTMTEEYAVFPSEQKVVYEDSTIINEKIINRNEWNYKLNKRQDISYRIVRYKDGTTKIFSGRNNWMHFKTEYMKNEYTGEQTKTFVDVEDYIDGRKEILLISARRDISDDYSLEVSNGELSLYYKPLGLTYSVYLGKIYSNVCNRLKQVDYIFDYFLGYRTGGMDQLTRNLSSGKKPPVVTVKGPNGNTLDLIDVIVFLDAGGRRQMGGYYDKTTQKMYYCMPFSKFFNNKMIKSGENNAYVMQVYSDVSSPEEINEGLQYGIKLTNLFYKKCDSLKLSRSEIENRINQMKLMVPPKLGISLVYCLPHDTIQFTTLAPASETGNNRFVI